MERWLDTLDLQQQHTFRTANKINICINLQIIITINYLVDDIPKQMLNVQGDLKSGIFLIVY